MSLLSLLRMPPPDAAIEIAPQYVAAIVVDGERAGSLRVVGHALEPLPPGCVVPSLTAPNLPGAAAVTEAIERAWAVLGCRPRRVALVVPDSVGKVSLVRFASVPARASDLDEMIRFQVRKAAPFRIEEAQVSHSPGLASPDGQEFVVVQARRDVVAEYEAACAQAGAHAGQVGLATLHVVNAVLALPEPPDGDWLLLHVADEAASIAILRGRHLVFFRHRAGEGEGHLEDLVHQTAMYYQDRLGGQGFARVIVTGVQPDGSRHGTRRTIESRLGTAVHSVSPAQMVRFDAALGRSKGATDPLTPGLGALLALRAE